MDVHIDRDTNKYKSGRDFIKMTKTTSDRWAKRSFGGLF